MSSFQKAFVRRSHRRRASKPTGQANWRIDHGARMSRVTSHGGRAHTLHSFATGDRAERRAEIASRIGRLAS